MQMAPDKILIVEDEKDTRFILEKLLSKNNYEAVCATNGAEALELLKTIRPKVILADWTMPVMDGIELCNEVKKVEDFKTIYFIILTARGSLKDRVTGLDVGADDFLIKPIENQELLARIRSGIRIHNLQNEIKQIEHSKALIEMAATIGHGFNNPLSSLVLSLKNIQDELKGDSQKQVAEDFLIIEESLSRIKKLVKDLTDLQNPEIINYASGNKMLKIG
jgi:sigma-B regulation protein RsbU (phosphoserine phosphatase)